MGQEIAEHIFEAEDFLDFNHRLRRETATLKRLFESHDFDSGPRTCGFELECWLVDRTARPAPLNADLLEAIDNPLIVPELSRFNFEINSSPCRLGPSCLLDMLKELDAVWESCLSAAQTLNCQPVMVGTLPTLAEEELSIQNMSGLRRYRALNEQIFRLRRQIATHLKIRGRDQFETSRNDFMLEAGTTSLQVHLKVTPKEAPNLFNTATVLSAPMAALCANSPFLFGKDLWDESRIPLFEQSVAIGSLRNGAGDTVGRVTLGSGYVRESVFEIFLENLNGYPILLPLVEERPTEELCHLRLHNGTIWRWNRPLVGIGASSKPHLRIEHRIPAAGPSTKDVIANSAFFIGCLLDATTHPQPLWKNLSFERAQTNLYAAAETGFNAQIEWTDGDQHPITRVLLDDLLPRAKAGLASAGLDRDEIDYFLEEIIGERIRVGQNGSTWQRAFVGSHGYTMQGLVARYIDYQNRGIPVHQWRT